MTSVRSTEKGWLSPTSAYLSVFWLFHFGLVFAASFTSETITELPDWATDIILAPETTKSALLAILFMACVWFGAELSGSSASARANLDGDRRSAPELAKVGWLVMAIGAGMSVFGIADVGLGTFFGSYDVFFEQSSMVSWAILVLTNGLFLLLAGGSQIRTVIRAAAVTYVPVAALCLLAGSRTAPMFSAVGLAVALHYRGVRFSTTALVIAAVGALVTIGVLQQIREQGVTLAVSSGGKEVEENPILFGVMEMGGSLNTVSASLQWMEGQELFHGSTFALPFLRPAQKLVGIEPLSLEDDPRFITEQIRQEFGPIGYSTVAEAYVNFAEWGVAAFALVWGLALGTLGRWSSRPYGLPLMGAFLVPMLMNIRNSFIFVPAWVFIGIAPILLAGLIATGRKSRFTSRLRPERHRTEGQVTTA
jgi:oligosaccharide repeat unit polymerase